MRLIDADELKKLFPDNGEGSWTYNETAKGYIDAQPTAYDPDKVVEVLEEEIMPFTHAMRPRFGKTVHFGFVQGIDRAIEIVKKGGVE